MRPWDLADEFGPMAEAGVGLDCLDCEFQTAHEAKADAHQRIGAMWANVLIRDGKFVEVLYG